MSTAFEIAAEFTMRHEGGDKVSNHPSDPGGLTKYGISQRAYPELDIRALTKEAALELYERDYWLKCQCDKMPQEVAIALFDFAFNSGTGRAVKELQRVLALEADGVVGPQTLAGTQGQPHYVARELNARRLLFLSDLATWPTFKGGWTRRVVALQGEISK